MTGENALKLREGDLVGFTKDIQINGYTWKHTDLIQVEYTEIRSGGHIEWYLKNLTWEKEGKDPCVQLFGMYWILNYAYKVTTEYHMNKTVIEHKFKVGDTVWFMCNNKPYSQKVADIEISFHKDASGSPKNQETKSCIKYRLYLLNNWYYEKDLFATKDELLDSLR